MAPAVWFGELAPGAVGGHAEKRGSMRQPWWPQGASAPIITVWETAPTSQRAEVETDTMPDPLPKPPGRPPGEPIIIKHPPPPPEVPEVDGSLDEDDDQEIKKPPEIVPEQPPPPAPWERADRLADRASAAAR
jgi:hypothetical protein